MTENILPRPDNGLTLVHWERKEFMPYSPNVVEALRLNARATTAAWVELCTTLDSTTAIDVKEFYDFYKADFSQFKGPLLGPWEFLHLVIDGKEGVDWAYREKRSIINGLNWAKSADMQRVTERVRAMLGGMKLDSSGSVSGGAGAAMATDDTEYDPSTIDPDKRYRAWLVESLVMDKNCKVGCSDLWLAFRCKFTAESDIFDADKQPLALKQLLRLVTDCFSHVAFTEVHKVHDIKALRWKKLPQGTVMSMSLHSVKKGFPERLREDAHQLLYLKPKSRTRAWFSMFFKEQEDMTISLRSLCRFYTIAFARSANTHIPISSDQLLEILKRTFKGITELEVSENHIVIQGLAIRKHPTSARDYLAKKRQIDFRRLPDIDPTDPRNQFNQGLMEDPLLAQQAHPSNGERPALTGEDGKIAVDANAAPGPFIQRLRRRAHDPPLPLGDEEPGFPGISMKLGSKRLKRKNEAQKKASVVFPGPNASKMPMPTVEDLQKIASIIIKPDAVKGVKVNCVLK